VEYLVLRAARHRQTKGTTWIVDRGEPAIVPDEQVLVEIATLFAQPAKAAYLVCAVRLAGVPVADQHGILQGVVEPGYCSSRFMDRFSSATRHTSSLSYYERSDIE
jgi:hypothetical protein